MLNTVFAKRAGINNIMYHLKRDCFACGNVVFADGAGCSTSLVIEFFSSAATMFLISSVIDEEALAIILVVNHGWVAEAMSRSWSSKKCWNLRSLSRV